MRSEESLEVLFVDDEKRVLDGLRRSFFDKSEDWSMRFAPSAEDALRLMDERPADVVISDMRMPSMDGAALLGEIRLRWPATVRFILSGQTNQAELMENIGAVHQFVQKPCTPDALDRAVTRTLRLAAQMEFGSRSALATSLGSLPVVPDIYRELLAALDDVDSDAEMIGRVVERDIGMTTKLLQMVNSAFFGLPRHVCAVKDAIVLIGTANLRELAITGRVFDVLSDDSRSSSSIAELWKASADVGALAADLARVNRQPVAVCDAARLAGTLSVIGRAILAHSEPDRFASAVDEASSGRTTLNDAEAMELGVTQQTVGAYALGLWGFDDEIVEAVAHQTEPERGHVRELSHPLPYVHLARSSYQNSLLVPRITPADEWLDSLGLYSTTGSKAA